MALARYLIFGDLHGRILPALRLAMRWEREHGSRLDGLLQVGELGYFPDIAPLDKATARHAADDPLELGTAWWSNRIGKPTRSSTEQAARPRPCGSRRGTMRTSRPFPSGREVGGDGRRASPWTPTASSAASVTAGSRRCPARSVWEPSGVSTTRQPTPAAIRPSGAESGSRASRRWPARRSTSCSPTMARGMQSSWAAGAKGSAS